MNPPIVYEVTKPTAQRTSNMTAMVQSIFRHLLRFAHERHVSKAPIPDIPGNAYMLVHPAGPGYRHLSETGAAVCLIPGPEFVLWITAAFTQGTAWRDLGEDYSLAAVESAPARGVVTSTTLEDKESPEAFHA